MLAQSLDANGLLGHSRANGSAITGVRVLLTRSGLSAGAQHPCCKLARHDDKQRKDRDILSFDASRRRWQPVFSDLFRSHFRGGPAAA
jgi:hypothetical protein